MTKQNYTKTILHIKRKNQVSLTKIFIKNKKTLISVILAIVFVACLIVANFISLYIIQVDTKTEEVENAGFEVYMLSLSKSKLENEAKSIAPDFQEIGAGGFIWKNDDYFHVIASCYINKNDAELVKNSIKLNQNLESEIFTVKFSNCLLKGSFDQEEKKVLTRSLAAAQIFYTSIYDIAVSLDTGVINEISAKLSVNGTCNNISTIYANFDTIYPSPIISPLKEVNAYLKSIVKLSQALATDERTNKTQTYSSHLKYRYLEALSNYSNFLNKIKK